MKKLFLLVAVALAAISAKGQTISNEYYTPGVNLYDTFTWSIDSVGYLHYNLTDYGPGSTDGSYYSEVFILNEVTGHYYVDKQLINGGSISGCVYIGLGDQFLEVVGGAGSLNNDNLAEDEWWDFEVSFDD